MDSAHRAFPCRCECGLRCYQRVIARVMIAPRFCVPPIWEKHGNLSPAIFRRAIQLKWSAKIRLIRNCFTRVRISDCSRRSIKARIGCALAMSLRCAWMIFRFIRARQILSSQRMVGALPSLTTRFRFANSLRRLRQNQLTCLVCVRVTGAYLQPGFVDSNGKGIYRGQNPPEGALFTVWVREFTGDEIKIVVTKATGQPVANLKAPGTPGFTRLNWDLRPSKDVIVEYGGEDPERFLPAGDYTAELTFGSNEDETNISC